MNFPQRSRNAVPKPCERARGKQAAAGSVVAQAKSTSFGTECRRLVVREKRSGHARMTEGRQKTEQEEEPHAERLHETSISACHATTEKFGEERIDLGERDTFFRETENELYCLLRCTERMQAR